jgi:hypothetical protein
MTAMPASRSALEGKRAAGPESARATAAQGGPVIVLTYAHSGAELLQSVLGRDPDLARTAGTGVLPMCEQAAAAWRTADGRPTGPLSALAAASIRVLATAIISATISGDGKRRWCETSTAPPAYAETFLQLFPGTLVLCLHRSCPDVIQSALHAGPWGLAGEAFAPFTSAHPVSAVAALTAYWAAHTGALLTFERAHPGACRRVRYEDLSADSYDDLRAFLTLGDGPGAPDVTGHSIGAPPGNDDPSLRFPAGHVPPGLLEQANDLMKELGYPPLGAAPMAAVNQARPQILAVRPYIPQSRGTGAPPWR